MNFPRSKFFSAFLLILLCKSLLFSQDLRRKAEENPLSAVLYLLSTTEKESRAEQKACLATSLAAAGRFEEIEDAARMVDEGSYVDKDFIALAQYMIAQGKVSEASRLVSFLIANAGDDEYKRQLLFKPLILLKRDADALELLNKFPDWEKTEGAFELARVYLETGQTAKALEVIGGVAQLVENSKYGEDKADLGLFYARLRKQPEALRFLQEALKKLAWKSGKPEYTEGRILDRVVDAYRALGKNEEAGEILTRRGEAKKLEEPATLIETAESFLARGDRAKALELFEQSLKRLNPRDYGDSFELGKLVEIYLSLGETEKAEKIAGSIGGSDNMQQKHLLGIADLYIKRKKNSKASELLYFALEQTKKIDTSEEESGALWTSKRWELAQYQSQIAIRFINLKADRQALELIAQIKKPYLRALTLTKFVELNKNRLPAEQLRPRLEEALSLLRRQKTDIFDSRKFDVYAVAARVFAEIEMEERANEAFAEALSALSREMIDDGSDGSLLFAMCSIGVEFDKSKIKPNEKLRESLRQIIKSWENEEY